MKHLQKTAIQASMVMVGLMLFAATIQADQWSKKTILTINEPIQIPTMVLAPGTYVFKLVDSLSDRHIVRVMNADETHVITTVLAIPNYRLRPSGKSAFGLWEMPAGSPPALRSWFYPGDNSGQEFAYSKTTAAMVTATTLTPSPVVPISEETKTEEAKTMEAPARQAEPAEAAPAPATPPPPAAPPMAIALRATDLLYLSAPAALKRLPGTASTSPLLGMVGLMSIGMALAVHTLRMP